MDGPQAAQQAGGVLQAYLRTTDEAEAQRHLERLVYEHAEPVIREVLQIRCRTGPSAGRLGRRREREEAEEIHQEIIVQLLERLYHFRHAKTDETIHDFRGYVAVIARHTCDRRLREKYPQRARLKNRLYYLLTRRKEFALWRSQGREWLGGLTAWRDEPQRRPCLERLQQLRDAPEALALVPRTEGGDAAARAADLLAMIFEWVRGPIALDELVDIVADLWEIHDAAGGQEDGALQEAQERAPDPHTDVAGTVGQHVYLERLWEEIRQLPPRQCAALLLNLRDAEGRGVIALLPLTGIASMQQIIEAIGMPMAEFAAMWNELPLDDAGIARYLGGTRQQVINLRKVARERLARRMKAAGFERV